MAYEHKITYILEMLDPDQLRPKAVDVPCLRIERMGTPCPELNIFLHNVIGHAFRWSGRTD
jgi:hypothetical protein